MHTGVSIRNKHREIVCAGRSTSRRCSVETRRSESADTATLPRHLCTRVHRAPGEPGTRIWQVPYRAPMYPRNSAATPNRYQSIGSSSFCIARPMLQIQPLYRPLVWIFYVDAQSRYTVSVFVDFAVQRCVYVDIVRCDPLPETGSETGLSPLPSIWRCNSPVRRYFGCSSVDALRWIRPVTAISSARYLTRAQHGVLLRTGEAVCS